MGYNCPKNLKKNQLVAGFGGNAKRIQVKRKKTGPPATDSPAKIVC